MTRTVIRVWVSIAAFLLAACAGGVSERPTATPSKVAYPPTGTSVAADPARDAQDPLGPPISLVAVSLSVHPTAIGVGETAEVVLSVAEVAELYGAEVHLRFDPTLLEVVDRSGSAKGNRLEHGGLLKVGFTVVNAVDAEAGTAAYAVAQMPPSKAVTGSGDLLRFLVRGKGPGTTAIQVESIILASARGEAIPHAIDLSGARLVIR